MPERSTRVIAVAAAFAVAVGAGAWVISRGDSDDDASSDGAATSQPVAATVPSASSGIALDVSAGGPYEISAGEPLTLTADISISRQSETVDDLTAIGDALTAYHAEHGSFPPAFLVDEAGQPTLSWRVLLLPYLGEQDLYERFDLSKAWDDPTNQALVAELPEVFAMSDRTGGPGETAYAGVAGIKSVFRSGAPLLSGGVTSGAVVDGDTMTMAVGPVGNDVSIAWTSPTDIDPAVHPSFGDVAGFDGPGDGVTPMLFLDGTVHSLLDDTATDVVASWSTIAGDSCSPPSGHRLSTSAGWDFDDDGEIDAYGNTVAFPTDDEGEHTVQLAVDDGFGGLHTVRTTVVVG